MKFEVEITKKAFKEWKKVMEEEFDIPSHGLSNEEIFQEFFYQETAPWHEDADFRSKMKVKEVK